MIQSFAHLPVFLAAARMESNGQPGRIHVSEAVATELKKFGYEGWLERRADTIHAKGKGESKEKSNTVTPSKISESSLTLFATFAFETVQTYWIVGAASRSTASGYSGDNSCSNTLTNDDTTTRRILGESRGDILMADKGFEDDEFLDLHEKLQHRLNDKKGEQTPTHRVRSDDSN